MASVDFSFLDDQLSTDSPDDGLIVLETLKPIIANGFHTLKFPDGSHRTFRIHRQRNKAKFKPGKRLIGILIGPDNSEDYEEFGEVTEKGINVWKSRQHNKKLMEYAALIWSIANGEKIEDYELMTDSRCLVCNRHLTDPLSLSRGIGPLCWERLGVTQS